MVRVAGEWLTGGWGSTRLNSTGAPARRDRAPAGRLGGYARAKWCCAGRVQRWHSTARRNLGFGTSLSGGGGRRAMSAVADRHIPCYEIGPDTLAKTGAD